VNAAAGAAAAARRDALRGHAAMLAFSALVAGSFSLGALVAEAIDPVALTAARFLIAAAILGAAAAAGPGFRRAHLATPWRYLLLGAVYAVYFVLMFEALKTAAPVAAAAVFTLTPAMAAGFGWVMLGQVTTPRMAAALAIGAAGALWVVFRADLAALFAFRIGRGEAIYFVGCLAHAAFTPLLRRLDRGEPASVSTALVIAGGLVVLAVWGWRDIAATDWAALPAIVWITLGYVAVFATALTFVLLRYAGRRLPAAKVMAYTYLVPAWVILWEGALGQPAVPPPVLAGVALTLAALALLLRREAGEGRAS
jgi:drug/metabolite transporter (DMT)-like permease